MSHNHTHPPGAGGPGHSHDHDHDHDSHPGHDHGSGTVPAGAPAPVEDSGSQALSNALRSSFTIVRFLMAGLVLAFVLSGVFTVAPNQVAVLLRFGKPVGTAEDRLLKPGLHWKLPYPIDEVVLIPVGESRTLTSTAGWYSMTPEEELAGSKTADNGYPYLQPGVDGYTLTGDGNIVHVRATMNYRITDAVRYAFEFANVTNLLQNVLDNALFRTAARFNADDALYRQRAAFREEVASRVNEAVGPDRIDLGVSIDPREVRIEPPLFVQKAFTDVLEAQQRRDKAVLDAESYARGATNKAIAEYEVVRQTSLTASNTLVNAVATDATNFVGLLPHWQADAQLLRQRLLAQTLEHVYTNAQFKAFLPARSDGRPRELRLQLNREPEAPTTIPSAFAK